MAWGYARGADSLGVDIIQNCEVTGITRDGGKVTGLETTRGTIRTKKIGVVTLWSIAADTGVSVETLLASNGALTASTFIHEGMEISLPGGVEVPTRSRATS